MLNNLKPATCITLLFILTACSHTLPHTPTDSMSKEQARSIIEQVIREDMTDISFHYGEVEITDEYLKIMKYKTTDFPPFIPPPLRRHITAVPIPTYLYFNNIGNVELTRQRDLYIIKIRDKEDVIKYEVHCAREDKARAFVDGLYSLRFN